MSAEKHGSSEYDDQVFLAEEDSGNHAIQLVKLRPNKRKVDPFDVELMWFISDNIEEARKLKQRSEVIRPRTPLSTSRCLST